MREASLSRSNYYEILKLPLYPCAEDGHDGGIGW